MIHVSGKTACVYGATDKVIAELCRAVMAVNEAMEDKNISAESRKRVFEGVFRVALEPKEKEAEEVTTND